MFWELDQMGMMTYGPVQFLDSIGDNALRTRMR